MHCYICNKMMTPEEIQFHPILKTSEPCFQCHEIIYETAYSGKFRDELQPLDDEELQDEFGNGAVETPDYEQYSDDLLPTDNQRWPY